MNAKQLAELLLRNPEAEIDFKEKSNWGSGFFDMNKEVMLVKSVASVDDDGHLHVKTSIILKDKPQEKEEEG